jgi:glycine reductase
MRCGATLAREIERQGVPTVVFAALPAIPMAFGAPRIMLAKAIRHPLGNPELPGDGERQLRRRMVEGALAALQTACDRPTLFPLSS